MENPNQMDTKTYKRCEFIIRQFLAVEKPTAELLARFHEWLLDGRHCREKNVIVRKVFFEALPDLNPAQPHPNDDLSACGYLEKILAPHKIN